MKLSLAMSKQTGKYWPSMQREYCQRNNQGSVRYVAAVGINIASLTGRLLVASSMLSLLAAPALASIVGNTASLASSGGNFDASAVPSFPIDATLISQVEDAPIAPLVSLAPVPRSEEEARSVVFNRVQLAMLPRRVASINSMTSGHSGAQAFRATMTDGTQYFAKVVLDWREIEKPLEFLAELDQSEKAAQLGFGPKVHFVDRQEGTLITDFLANELSQWNEGGVSPRLEATARAMKLLHTSERGRPSKRFEEVEAQTYWRAQFARVSGQDQGSPGVTLSRRVAAQSAHMLAAIPFLARPTHGDFHQNNVIFSSGKAWLIDWGSFKYSDPMRELANYAYHIDLGINDLDMLILAYGGLSDDEVSRVKGHLCQMHALRLLETFRGMPWDRAEFRERKLDQHRKWLAEDEAWLANYF